MRRNVIGHRVRILAATVSLLLAASAAHALDSPIAPGTGDGVPRTEAPASPVAQSLAQSTIDDEAITRRVSAAIRADPRLAGADVSVNTDHGVVNLDGNVRTREQAVAAAESAQAPDGVMRIESHLSVTPP